MFEYKEEDTQIWGGYNFREGIPSHENPDREKGRVKLKEDHFISELEKRKISKNRDNIKRGNFLVNKTRQFQRKSSYLEKISATIEFISTKKHYTKFISKGYIF